MPDYLKRTGRDLSDDLIIRTGEGEKKSSRMAGPATKRPSIDRGSIPHVAAPFEGQMMIQYADEAVGATPVSPDVGSTFHGEQPYYFSNGEWRSYFTTSSTNSAEEHLYRSTLTVTANTSVYLDWGHYDGATLLDLSTADKPTFLTAGVYAIDVGIKVESDSSGATGFPIAFEAELSVQQGLIAWPPGTDKTMGLTDGCYVKPSTTQVAMELSRVAKMAVSASDFFQVSFFNGDAIDRDVVAILSVVLILEA